MHADEEDDGAGDDGWEDAAEDADGNEGHEDLEERADEGRAEEHAVRVRAGTLGDGAIRGGRRGAGAIAVHGIEDRARGAKCGEARADNGDEASAEVVVAP